MWWPAQRDIWVIKSGNKKWKTINNISYAEAVKIVQGQRAMGETDKIKVQDQEEVKESKLTRKQSWM